MTMPVAASAAGAMFPIASSDDPMLSLTDAEKQIAVGLAARLYAERPLLELRELYYDGLQKMQDLGISIPPSLSKLRTVIGWCRIGVDAVANRLRIEGFRYPGVTETDDDLWAIYKANRLASELPMALRDALIFSRAYLVVGPGDESTGGQPLITAESPLNMTAVWNPRTRRCTAALQVFIDNDLTSDTFGQEVASLYLPAKTVLMSRTSVSDPWSVSTVDNHGIGRVPVVRLSNRQRTGHRDGQSEITPEWMNTTDSACRTLLGMEVTREFYGAPRRYILGASEEAFQRPDGTAVTAWEAYLNKVWAVERDEEGNVPTVGEFKSGDPSTHTKLLEAYAKVMSGEMGVPPHFLGIYSDGNPASADAIRSGYEELVIRTTGKHAGFGDEVAEAMRLALLIRDGAVPENAALLEVDWMDPSPVTIAATADAITKQVTVGSIPAHSDVTLKRLGYTAAERARLEQDRLVDDGDQILAQLAHSLVAKDAKVDKGIAETLNPPATAAPALGAAA